MRGCTVHYLDTVFRNLSKGGVLMLTSTDDSALFGHLPGGTVCGYGGYLTKTSYSKELACRLIIAAAVR